MNQKSDPVPERHNMYYAIHRGLRLGHSRMIERLGATHFADPTEAGAAVAELRAFLALGRRHLESEESEIHPEIEAREPGASAHASEGHDEHEAAFEDLEALANAVERSTGAAATQAGAALYRRYCLFAAADFLHMDGEETDLLGTMHRLFTDAELQGIEGRIVAKADPGKMMGYLSLIIPALSRPERIGMLSGMRAALPGEVFAAVMEGAVRASLPAAEVAAIEAALTEPVAA
jgi:hypothetical protein